MDKLEEQEKQQQQPQSQPQNHDENCVVILQEDEGGSPEVRKVQDLKGSSVYINLPNKFAKDCGIAPGDLIKISKATGNRLVLEKVVL